MPRASLNPDKAKQGGGGIEAGNYEVIGAKFQNIKTDFRPNQLYLVLSLAVLDKDGDRVRGAEEEELRLSFGEKSLEAFHPGMADSADDTDPTDQGDGVDAEGNTVWQEEGSQFNKSCAAMVFMETLAKAGFPKATLDRCWAEDYIGLKFELATEEPKKLNEKYGLRLNTKPMKDRTTGEPVNISYKIAQRWINANEGKEAKTKKANGKVDHEEKAAAASSSDPESVAAAVLAAVAQSKPGEKNKIKSKAALVGFATNAYAKAKYDPKKLSEVQKLIKDDDFLVGAIAELGGSFDPDSGVTVFAEA